MTLYPGQLIVLGQPASCEVELDFSGITGFTVSAYSPNKELHGHFLHEEFPKNTTSLDDALRFLQEKYGLLLIGETTKHLEGLNREIANEGRYRGMLLKIRL